MDTDRIVHQAETTKLEGGLSNATRGRLERKGLHPKRFQITENGGTGYLFSEILKWIAERAANRDPTDKTAAASAVLAERRSAKRPPPARRGRTRQLAELPGSGE